MIQHGFVKKIKKGVYQINVELEPIEEGVRNRKRFIAKYKKNGRCLNSSEADNLLLAILRDPLILNTYIPGAIPVEEAPPPPPASPTFRNYAERLLRRLAALNKIEVPTEVSYRYKLQKHAYPTIGDKPIDQITTADLNDLYAEQLLNGKVKRNGEKGPLSPRTVRSHHIAIDMVLSNAVEDGLLDGNPADKASPPEHKKVNRSVQHVLDEKTTDAFLDFLSTKPEYPFLYLAFVSGLRRGELAAIPEDCISSTEVKIVHSLARLTAKMKEEVGDRWINAYLAYSDRYSRELLELLHQDPSGIYFKRPKSDSSIRGIPIEKETYVLLKKLMVKNKENKLRLGPAYRNYGLLFCHDDGRPINPDFYSAKMKQYTIEFGIDMRLHDTRHTFVTLLLKKTKRPAVVAELAGHKSEWFTVSTYGHVLPGEKEDAISSLSFKPKINVQ